MRKRPFAEEALEEEFFQPYKKRRLDAEEDIDDNFVAALVTNAIAIDCKSKTKTPRAPNRIIKSGGKLAMLTGRQKISKKI